MEPKDVGYPNEFGSHHTSMAKIAEMEMSMALTSVAILAGSTIAASGGTALTLTPDGQPVVSGIHVSDASVADARIRPNATFKNKSASLIDPAKNSWSKGKRSTVYTRPKILAAGNIIFPLLRIELEDHPEMTAAEVSAIVKEGLQLFFAASTANFVATGSLG